MWPKRFFFILSCEITKKNELPQNVLVLIFQKINRNPWTLCSDFFKSFSQLHKSKAKGHKRCETYFLFPVGTVKKCVWIGNETKITLSGGLETIRVVRCRYYSLCRASRPPDPAKCSSCCMHLFLSRSRWLPSMTVAIIHSLELVGICFYK